MARVQATLLAVVIRSHRTDTATSDPAEAPAGTDYAPSVFAVLFLGHRVTPLYGALLHRAAEHQHDTHTAEQEPIVFSPALW